MNQAQTQVAMCTSRITDMIRHRVLDLAYEDGFTQDDIKVRADHCGQGMIVCETTLPFISMESGKEMECKVQTKTIVFDHHAWCQVMDMVSNVDVNSFLLALVEPMARVVWQKFWTSKASGETIFIDIQDIQLDYEAPTDQHKIYLRFWTGRET